MDIQKFDENQIRAASEVMRKFFKVAVEVCNRIRDIVAPVAKAICDAEMESLWCAKVPEEVRKRLEKSRPYREGIPRLMRIRKRTRKARTKRKLTKRIDKLRVEWLGVISDSMFRK